MNTSRAYWACQLLGWGLYGASQVSNAIATLAVPWERIVLEIALLNVAAIGLTHLLDLLARLDHVPRVIFTTAYDHHAVRAFEVNAPCWRCWSTKAS